MDYCYDRHEHKYLVTYHPPKPGARCPQWTVCEDCLSRKRCYNDPDQVQSIAILA